jgi:hypothetical protein
MSHVPKNPVCEVCNAMRPYVVQARRTGPESEEKPLKFGDFLFADHILTGRGQHRGRRGEVRRLA